VLRLKDGVDLPKRASSAHDLLFCHHEQDNVQTQTHRIKSQNRPKPRNPPSSNSPPAFEEAWCLQLRYYDAVARLQEHSDIVSATLDRQRNLEGKARREHKAWIAQCPDAERRAHVVHESEELFSSFQVEARWRLERMRAQEIDMIEKVKDAGKTWMAARAQVMEKVKDE
jgi:hypothetical protein